jgi:hypothetical protein
MQPDIAGFRRAQEELIDKLGQDVTFLVPQPPTYPPGTVLDPETGRPHDPTIRPIQDPDAEVVVRCSVVYRPILRQGEDDVTGGASGPRRTTQMAVTMKVVDRPRVEGATKATVNDLSYKVTDIVPDGLTEVQRYIAFLEAR